MSVADASLVAACGLYCGECRSFIAGKCPGCAKNVKASWCTVRSCCADKETGTCAGCTREDAEPMNCPKFNNFMSKLFAFFFKSDRAACIKQIKELGVKGHAEKMAESGLYNRIKK